MQPLTRIVIFEKFVGVDFYYLRLNSDKYSSLMFESMGLILSKITVPKTISNVFKKRFKIEKDVTLCVTKEEIDKFLEKN